MAGKKDKTNRETKAGLMGKSGSEEDYEREENTPETDSKNLPKISKEEAQTREKGKPFH